MGITQQIGASSLIKPGVIDNAAARPASPYEGQVIFQKDTDQLLVWNGTAWVIPNAPAQNPSGLELITTQTIGSAVSSVTVTNAFSSTYDSYRIIITGGAASADTDLRGQLGPSSVTNYNTSYYGALFYIGTIGATSVSVAAMSNTAQVQWLAKIDSTSNVSSIFDVLSPNQSKPTQFQGGNYSSTNGTGFMNAMHNVSSAFTDIKIFPNAGTLTGGTISVYGYRK